MRGTGKFALDAIQIWAEMKRGSSREERNGTSIALTHDNSRNPLGTIVLIREIRKFAQDAGYLLGRMTKKPSQLDSNGTNPVLTRDKIKRLCRTIESMRRIKSFVLIAIRLSQSRTNKLFLVGGNGTNLAIQQLSKERSPIHQMFPELIWRFALAAKVHSRVMLKRLLLEERSGIMSAIKSSR